MFDFLKNLAWLVQDTARLFGIVLGVIIFVYAIVASIRNRRKK